MKKVFLLVSFTILFFSVSAFAQTTDNDNKEQISIDTLMDQDAQHNLNVAWQYFKLKKAYKAVVLRMDETVVAHPTFSKMDEVLYLIGMSSYYLLEDKGKQKINLEVLNEAEQERFADARLREDAKAYLTQLIDQHSDSKYAGKAKKTLKKLEKDK